MPCALRVDRGVDADDSPVDVEQRAAGVAGVDRGVGLDEVGERAALLFDGTERPRAETTPVVTVCSRPNGLPMAMTVSPIIRSRGRADRRGGQVFASTRSTARSLSGSTPMSFAASCVPSLKLTVMRDGAFDDVVVGDDDASARPDEAGAERLRGVAAVASAEDAERIEEWIDFAPA